MRTKNELYQEAMRTVAARRQMARARAEDARAEAEAAIPALRHAEEEVRVRGIRCALAGAAGKDRTEAAAALADAKQKLTALLAQSGRPADALEPRFVCPKCQDTGSVNGRTCECVHKVMQQLRRKEIEALSSLSIASFDTMELRYYPNRADEKVGGAIRPYMADMLADLRSYAEEFDHHMKRAKTSRDFMHICEEILDNDTPFPPTPPEDTHLFAHFNALLTQEKACLPAGIQL